MNGAVASLIGLALGCLALSGCACLLEASLLGLSREEVAALCRTRPRTCRRLRLLQDDLVGIALALRGVKILVQCSGAALGGLLAWGVGGPLWLAAFVLLYALLLVVGCEVLAGALGRRHARSLAPAAALTLRPLLWVMGPARRGRRQSRRRSGPEAAVLAEFSALLRLASLQGARETGRTQAFARARSLSRLKVKDVMVERSAIKFLSAGMTLAQGLVEAHLHHHTRFPLLAGEDPGEVIGYVNFKDIVAALQLNPANPTLAGVARPILTVRAEDSLSSLLDRLTREYQHIALVRDRGGAVAGLATLEDVLEAVLSGMSAKGGRLPEYCHPIAENRCVAGGGVSVQSLRSTLNLRLPDMDGTLDDLLRQLCGGTPSLEQEVSVAGTTFTVRRLSGGHVREAIVQGAPPAEPPAAKGP